MYLKQLYSLNLQLNKWKYKCNNAIFNKLQKINLNLELLPSFSLRKHFSMLLNCTFEKYTFVDKR